MVRVQTRIGEFIDLQQKVVREVAELMVDWQNDSTTYLVARRLLSDLGELTDEMKEIVIASPVGALQNPTFGWASYEVKNAQLNLVFLIQFGKLQDAGLGQVKPMGPYGPDHARPDLSEEEFAALTDCVGLVVSRLAPTYEVYGGITVPEVTKLAEGALDKVQQAFGLLGSLAEARVVDQTGGES